MNTNDLRRAMVNYQSGIRSIILSKSQVKLYKHIRDSMTRSNMWVTSSEVAKSRGLSAQNAWCQLNTLYKKGYLARESRKQDSGAHEWAYTIESYLR